MKRRALSVLLSLLVLGAVLGISIPGISASKVEDARKSVVCVLCKNGDGFSLGTGFGIGKKGSPVQYIVTNFHVIEANPQQVAVWISQDDFIAARPVFQSKAADLAVLQLEKQLYDRYPVTILKTEGVSVAQKVFALGFPGDAFKLEDNPSARPEDVTVSSGIISKKTTINGVAYYQIDVPINHGNSGGPLITEDGAVVGINTLGITTGINAAIQIDELLPHLDASGIPYELFSAGKAGTEVSSPKPGDGKQGDGSGDTNRTAGNNPGTAGEKKQESGIISFLNNNKIIIGVLAVLVLLGCVLLAAVLSKSGTAQKQAPVRNPVPVNMNGNMNQMPPLSGRPVLIGTTGYYSGKSFDMGSGSLVLGRDAKVCNIIYPGGTPGISHRHCEIRYDTAGGRFILVDGGSTYGTFKGAGEKLVPGQPCYLNPGESFYLASSANKFEVRMG